MEGSGEPRSIEAPQDETWDMCEELAARFFSKVPEANQHFLLSFKNFSFIEVSSPELCDVILNFCPRSEVGPCVEALLKETPACKPTFLALMHHTEDPAYVVSDSSSFEEEQCKKKVDIVNLLYHETELLKCETNDWSIKKILGRLEWDMCEDAKEAECPVVRIRVVVPRSVTELISPFKACFDDSANMTEVASSEWSDLTLAFCPIVSRVGTDIESALKKIEDTKPAILVAMHHTYNEEYVIPNTSRFGANKDVLIVDCLFHKDVGLLHCKANQEALDKINTRLYEEQKKKTPQTVGSSLVTQNPLGGLIDYTYDFTRSSRANIEHLISFFYGSFMRAYSK